MLSNSNIKHLSNYLDLTNPLFFTIQKASDCWDVSSQIDGSYYNYIIPFTDNFLNHLISDPIKDKAIYLIDSFNQNNRLNQLIRNGYKLEDQESWLVFAQPSISHSLNKDIYEVDNKTFDQYKNLMNDVFLSDFPQNPKYLELCEQSFQSKFQATYPHLISKFYAMYQGDQMVSGGGLICDSHNKTAYLHSGATLSQYRRQGLQTKLFKHRLAIASQYGCAIAYTLVSLGSQSWHNAIRVGFEQVQLGYILKYSYSLGQYIETDSTQAINSEA